MKVTKPHPQITVYDDVFAWDCQSKIYEALCGDLNYYIGWGDHFHSSDKFLYTSFDGAHWQHMLETQSHNHWMNRMRRSEPFLEFEGRTLLKSVVNLTTMADTNESHTHPGQDVLLYYGNPEWKTQWQGETFFLDPFGKDIIYTSPYKPNRMIMFDGELVHRFNGQSRSAPKFRFSISTFFEKENAQIENGTDNSGYPVYPPDLSNVPPNEDGTDMTDGGTMNNMMYPPDLSNVPPNEDGTEILVENAPSNETEE